MTRQSFKVKPAYLFFLALAIIFYVAGVCAIHSDLYKKVCALEHKLIHAQQAGGSGCSLAK